MGTRLIRVLPALAAPRSRPNGPECIFPLDAAFRFKLLCGNPRLPHSSRLGETCPPISDAEQRGLWNAGRTLNCDRDGHAGAIHCLHGQAASSRARTGTPSSPTSPRSPCNAAAGDWRLLQGSDSSLERKLEAEPSQEPGGKWVHHHRSFTRCPDALSNDAFTFDFHCDGKEYSNPNGEALTTSCIQMNTDKWKLTYRRKGTITSEVFWDLSPDGGPRLFHGKSIRPDGSSRPVLHASRTGATKGRDFRDDAGRRSP